ncbi:zinc ribbon domain-containing protein [Halalkalicoccus salilacus]|uniref:zinc ribbon domain-containing protein n=1 Tax=Halalkalicoccus TaxID=332246 RepID=UPI002F96AE25
MAFENLTRIRELISNASTFQQWAFRRIRKYTEYKAAECRIAVETVASQYTSQQCSHVDCSFTHEDNCGGDDFECLKCVENVTPTTTQRRTSHESYARTGTNLGLEGLPVTWP